MKAFLTLVAVLMFLAAPALAEPDWCYQETANVNTSCGGLSTGAYWNITGQSAWYNGPDTYDGDWASAGRARDATYHAIMWINYTKPSGSTSSSMIRYKGTGSAIANYTIPITCWNAFNNKVVLRVNSTYGSWNRIECIQNASVDAPNSTVLVAEGTSGVYIYEEAMVWAINIVNTPPNLTSSETTFGNCMGTPNFFLLSEWNDNEGDAINNTFTEGNFSGTFQNYTGIQEGYINRLELTIVNGNYTYRSFASDQHGLQGVSNWTTTEFLCEEITSPSGRYCYDNTTMVSWQLVSTCINDNCTDTNTATFSYCDNGCSDTTGQCNMPRWQMLLIMAAMFIPFALAAWYFGRRH
jgi:hypothetical protein